MINPVEHLRVQGPGGLIAVQAQGPASGQVVLMTHSILSSSMMWIAQAALLADRGYRVIRADTRGHGQSEASAAPYTMQDLVDDSIAVLDGLKIERAHYIGLSLGGMSGFGVGIQHARRLRSLVLCDARADMTPAFAAPWDERIAVAHAQGCQALAQGTAERWFGAAFLQTHPAVANQFLSAIGSTSVAGFEGCARAIQGLDFLPQVSQITTPTTMIVGANDGPLPQAMQDLQTRIPGSRLEIIAGAGHLPNIDQAEAFNAALLRHFSNNT
jgi:3-oxoadipate enol-lactonase